MALRRYQHKFLQPLEIDQERVASSLNTNLTATNLTVTNSTVTTQTVSKLSTNNFFNSDTPDFTPSYETLTIFGDPTVTQGAIAHIRNNKVSVNDANVFGGLKFSSSPGADFIIGKSTQLGVGYLQVRRENGTTLLSMDGSGNLAVDTNVLYVDATNNRVGINTTTPGAGISLDVLDGEIRAGRIDASNEGGQVSYCRSSDNTTAWYQDVFGNTANPIFRTVDVTNSAVRTNIDSSGNFTINSGNLVIGTSGKGIDFSATANSSGTMTSEILTDYEEGTWVPTITFGGGNTGMTYASRVGRYIRVGSIVHVTAQISLGSKGTSTGSAALTGLPFTVASSAYSASAYADLAGLTFTSYFSWRIEPSGTQGTFIHNAGAALTDTAFANNFQVILSASYIV
jgi:hypothetical protein